MGTILLFYKYVHIEHPKAIMKWHKKLCQELELTGRVIFAHEGVNGTVGGSTQATQAYKKAMDEHPLFGAIDFKESPGGAHMFPRMRIVVKDEIVNLGLDTKKITAHDGGQHLTPEQAHAAMQKNNKNLVILDARNNYESRIGTFKNALTPDIQNFRDFPEYVEQHADEFKDKEVLMFCTGGIRCERASTVVKQTTSAKKVYQIEGGIHRYAEQYPDGFFRGKNYVFDSRIAVPVNDDVVAVCDGCSTTCDDYTNCINAECNQQIIMCVQCLDRLGNTCSNRCYGLVQNKQVVIRTIPAKTVAEHLS